MRYLQHWENFRGSDQLNEEFTSILSKLDNFKFLRGSKLVSFFSTILPQQVKDLINVEVAKYTHSNIIKENLEFTETEKSKIISDLSNEVDYSSVEFDSPEGIKKSLNKSGVEVDSETIERCESSVNSIYSLIDRMRLGSVTSTFLKFAAICVFFFFVNSQSFSQTQKPAQDTTKILKTDTSGLKPKLVMSSTAIDCFEYDRDGAYHIVEVPGLNKKDLKLKLQENINELRLKINRKLLGKVSQIKYSNFSDDEIRGEIQFKISPRDRNGVTEAQFVITIKDGKYKAQILNPKFIPVGQQRPGSPQFSDPIRNPERSQREIDRENERWRKNKRVREECNIFFLALLEEFNESTPDF